MGKRAAMAKTQEDYVYYLQEEKVVGRERGEGPCCIAGEDADDLRPRRRHELLRQ